MDSNLRITINSQPEHIHASTSNQAEYAHLAKRKAVALDRFPCKPELGWLDSRDSVALMTE